MYLKQISVKNFRMLRDVTMSFETNATVIVGSNNSGKTSLATLFDRIYNNSRRFNLMDFSLSTIDNFWNAYQLYRAGKLEESEAQLPVIQIELEFDYADGGEFGPLSEFVIDFDIECTKSIALLEYRPRNAAPKTLFEKVDLKSSDLADQKSEFFRFIRNRIEGAYEIQVTAIDPTDRTNTKGLDLAHFQRLLGLNFIGAHRGLDDQSVREQDVLGGVLRSLYKKSAEDNASTEDKETLASLEESIRSVQSDIDVNFSRQLNQLLPTIRDFGYPGLSAPNLATETILEIEGLLNNSTKVRYSRHPNLNLPESYNGLGSRNLIFILFQIYEFYKDHKTKAVESGTHLIFIEEPEAHLHPQMQEVFIRQLSHLAEELPKRHNSSHPWNVQFVVTTHSSHIANEAPFDCIRYFSNHDRLILSEDHVIDTELAEEDYSDEIRYTRIKDLKSGLIDGDFKQDHEFLHKYLTLTRCDLFFADKAILIEGTSERLILPKMIEKGDEGIEEGKLSSQYLTVMEVGGAYAYKFFGLLEFLELPSLIITDLDSGNGSHGKACPVEESEKTTNTTINKWFKSDDSNTQIRPTNLIVKPASEKIKGSKRLAFQIPDDGRTRCGRSFEEAFMLANMDLFGLSNEADAYDKAKEIDKTDFALKYAIEEIEWSVPKYISEGLTWLREFIHSNDVGQVENGEEEEE
jgi:predicted ATP-dependent endonuclease of OLD family